MIKIFFLFLIASAPLFAAEYYLAPNGSDDNDGSFESPFFTINKANAIVKPGDAVFIRGGTYQVKTKHIKRYKKIWAYVYEINTSGENGKPITYSTYKDEKAVFDFSQVVTPKHRIFAFHVTASWVNLKGFDVTGVQVYIKGHTQSECFHNEGSNNIYEDLRMYRNQAIGFYLTRGSNNLILNCDAFENHDYTSGDGLGGNVDGFGAHPQKGSVNNIFRGCRAWFNSDDGYDCINSHEAVTFENCFALFNGFSSDFKSLADGNGFKIGGYGSTPASRLPKSIPRHVVRNCISVRNKANGFYANHHPAGGDWLSNRAFMNKNNFDMLGRMLDNKTDIPGKGHFLKENISFKARKKELNNCNEKECRIENNVFDTSNFSSKDFQSLDYKKLLLDRINGEVPGAETFMKFMIGEGK